MEKELMKLKDIELQTIIDEFTFIECSCGLIILKDIYDIIIDLAKQEQKRRQTVEEIYPVEEILDNRDFVD